MNVKLLVIMSVVVICYQLNAHYYANWVQTRKHCNTGEEALEKQWAVDTKDGQQRHSQIA